MAVIRPILLRNKAYYIIKEYGLSLGCSAAAEFELIDFWFSIRGFSKDRLIRAIVFEVQYPGSRTLTFR